MCADINAGRHEQIVPQFAANHRHIMYGDHALGGERYTIKSTAAWYARLQRWLPDLRFDVHAVAVTGWPWRTTARVSWNDHFTLPNGSAGSNQGVHVFGLACGRVTALAVHCDTAKLAKFCAQMTAAAVSEAASAPISDGSATRERG